MVRRPVGQGRVDLPQGGQEVNEEAGFHGEWRLQGSRCGVRAGSPGKASTSAVAARLRSAERPAPRGDAAGKQVTAGA